MGNLPLFGTLVLTCDTHLQCPVQVMFVTWQVELLEILGSMNFKKISYLESISEDIQQGEHHFQGVSCLYPGRAFSRESIVCTQGEHSAGSQLFVHREHSAGNQLFVHRESI